MKNKNKILLIIGYLFGNYDLLFSESEKTSKPEWITVFVHGSFSLRPHLKLGNMFKMLHDTIEESVYYRSTEINRRDPFFYKNQAMGNLGLHKIDLLHPHNNAAAPVLAAAFEEVCTKAGYAPSNHYYTFGWSGLVSNKLRFLEADFLYNDLAKMYKSLKDQGINPKVRLIGYSHGGNLALQLGAIHTTKKKKEQFVIDELWLLGTPIQVETDYLVNSPVFKRVFNFYSRSDNVQPLDFFSVKRFFSEKKLTKRHNFSLPDKLYQVRIKVTKYQQKSCKKEFDAIPQDKKLLKQYFNAINFDPGHFELWFMGWTLLTYRCEFPFYPLPSLTFLPLITHYLEQNPQAPHDVVAEFLPDFEKINITPYHTLKVEFNDSVPFIKTELLEHMKKHALKFIPDDYNMELYNQKVYGAVKIAEHEWAQVKKVIAREKKKTTKTKVINLHQGDPVYKGHIPACKK